MGFQTCSSIHDSTFTLVMNVIHIEEKAFYEMIEQIVERLSAKYEAPVRRWIDGAEAMDRLNVKSTTLQKLRDTGAIEFTKPSKKIILYCAHSIDDYLEQHKQSKF